MRPELSGRSLLAMNMEDRNPPLMSGVPELVILSLLDDRAMYGYEIGQLLTHLSRAALNIGESVLYPALHSLESRKLLRARPIKVAGRVRIYYTLTARGHRRLARVSDEWRLLARGVEAILRRKSSTMRP